MHKYVLSAASLVLLLLSACATPSSPISQSGNALGGNGGTAHHRATATATASGMPASTALTPVATVPAATATSRPTDPATASTPQQMNRAATVTPRPAAPAPAAPTPAAPTPAAPTPAAPTPAAPTPAAAPVTHATSGTSQSVWETSYAAIDNDPSGSRAIAYPSVHSQAGGTGTYNDPITLAADRRWLPVGTKVYAPRWHKYYVMEDECVECEGDWSSSHFHHVDLYMSSSVQSAVVSCENAATKDQAENDTIIINPDPNRPVDTTPLYTDAGGCVIASHQYRA